MSSPASIEARLAEARRRYLRSLAERAGSVRAAAGAVTRDDRARERLEMIAHQLAGSAGLHGLEPIARLARELEAACRSEPSGDLLAARAATLADALNEAASAA